MTVTYDVVVVGAGPAGSVAALELARRGIRVAMIEKRRLPRDKVCGDALIPDSLQILRAIGLLDRVREIGQATHEVRIHAPDGTRVDVPGEGLCVQRAEFDALLAKAAVDAGAVLLPATEAFGFQRTAGGAIVAIRDVGGQGRISARLVILACGADPRVLARFGLDRRSRPSAVALRAYFRLHADVPDDVLQLWYDRTILPGYGWIFPLGDGLFNIGSGIFYDRRRRPDLAALFDRFRMRCASVREALAGAERLTPIRGAPLRTGLAGCDPVGDRLLVVGEAVGTTYAFSGEGIGKAMASARIAAEVGAAALGNGDPSVTGLADYRRRLARELAPRYRHYERAQRWLRFPFVVNRLAHQACARAEIRQALADVYSERRAPTDLLSLRRLVSAA